jgi:hypothetical protein
MLASWSADPFCLKHAKDNRDQSKVEQSARSGRGMCYASEKSTAACSHRATDRVTAIHGVPLALLKFPKANIPLATRHAAEPEKGRGPLGCHARGVSRPEIPDQSPAQKTCQSRAQAAFDHFLTIEFDGV